MSASSFADKLKLIAIQLRLTTAQTLISICRGGCKYVCFHERWALGLIFYAHVMCEGYIHIYCPACIFKHAWRLEITENQRNGSSIVTLVSCMAEDAFAASFNLVNIKMLRLLFEDSAARAGAACSMQNIWSIWPADVEQPWMTCSSRAGLGCCFTPHAAACGRVGLMWDAWAEGSAQTQYVGVTGWLRRKDSKPVGEFACSDPVSWHRVPTDPPTLISNAHNASGQAALLTMD